jgi:hypothetical protein
MGIIEEGSLKNSVFFIHQIFDGQIRFRPVHTWFQTPVGSYANAAASTGSSIAVAKP